MSECDERRPGTGRSPVVLMSMITALLGLIRLTAVPPLWWDEGWTLSVARNWVELGHYGRLLNGEPTSAGLAAAFPVIAPIALSFRLLGIGIWQGRLPNVCFMVAALVLLRYLAGRLYNRSVAIGTLAVLLLMPAHLHLHPALLGRQVLAEPPMLFYLLAGYACFLSAWRSPLSSMPLTVLLWSIALNTKAQALPFWTASLLLPFLITLLRRNWKSVSLLGTGLLGSLMMYRLVRWLQQLLLHGQMMPGSPLPGLYLVTALVPVASIRLNALIKTLIYGLPALLGLGYATWRFVKSGSQSDLSTGSAVVRLALITLAGSWFAWFVLLSAGSTRYMAPTIFASSIFVSAFLHEVTDHYSLSHTFKHGARAFRHFNRQNAAALTAILIGAMTIPATVLQMYYFYFVYPDSSAQQVATFLNSQTSPDALVETWQSEIHFLLDRRYHYPSDQVHVQLLRRERLGEDVHIAYDPLAVDPDYLVVKLPNHDARAAHIYEIVGAMGAFRLLRTYGGSSSFAHYDVYERIR